ncbi:MAG: four helix bundle protein [Patescibacteria group bacterium]
MIKEFYDLDVWEKGHQLVLEIYRITKDFPKEEKFGIIDQLRRAASSITANIAEGFERYHFNDKIKFYYQARGSVAEVQNFLILSKDLGYIKTEKCEELNNQADIIRQLINGLIRSISNQKEKSHGNN